LKRIRHAGAIFLGRYSPRRSATTARRPESRAADLAHGAVFLALGRVRLSEALGAYLVSRKGAQKLGKLAMSSPAGEGFQAHARSAELRLGKTPKGKP